MALSSVPSPPNSLAWASQFTYGSREPTTTRVGLLTLQGSHESNSCSSSHAALIGSECNARDANAYAASQDTVPGMVKSSRDAISVLGTSGAAAAYDDDVDDVVDDDAAVEIGSNSGLLGWTTLGSYIVP